MIATRLSRRELSSAVRNYWFVVNGGLFLVGGLVLLLFGQQDVSVLGYRGVARSLTGLLQLALFVVPLMALFPATAAIAGERELGTLDYLLAQPLTRSQVFLGKWCGVAAAVGLSILAGFTAIGVVALGRGVPAALFLSLVGLTLLLAATFVSFGLWLSAASSTQGRATSLGLTLWIGTLALGSLGLMGAFVGWGLPPAVLEVWALANPVEAFRMALVVLVDPGLAMLGPVGEELADRFGAGGLVALAVSSLAGWCLIAFWAGRKTFDAPVAGGDASLQATHDDMHDHQPRTGRHDEQETRGRMEAGGDGGGGARAGGLRRGRVEAGGRRRVGRTGRLPGGVRRSPARWRVSAAAWGGANR